MDEEAVREKVVRYEWEKGGKGRKTDHLTTRRMWLTPYSDFQSFLSVLTQIWGREKMSGGGGEVWEGDGPLRCWGSRSGERSW